MAVLAIIGVVLVFVLGGDREGDSQAAGDSIFDGPFEMSADVTVRSIYGEPELSGAAVDMLVQYDPNGREMLLDMGFTYGSVSVKGNQVYLSEDLIALSIPDIYSRYRYITMDTDGFASRWNSSQWGYYLSSVPSNLNLREEIAALFDADTGEFSPAAALLDSRMQEYVDHFYDDATFTNEGQTSVSVGGKTLTLEAQSYTFSASAAKSVYDGMIDIMDEYMQSYLGQMAQMSPYYSYRDMLYEWTDMVEELKNLHFPNGMKITYYIDSNKQTNRIEIDQVSVGYYGEPDIVTGGFWIDLSGERELADTVDMEFWLRSPYNDEISLTFNMDHSIQGGSHVLKAAMNAYEDRDQVFDVSYSLEWQDDNRSGGAIALSMEAGDNRDRMGMTLTGTLYEGTGEYRIENGKFDVYVDYQNIMGVDFNFGLRSISRVEIDLSNAVDLFTLDPDQFMEEIYSGIMSLAYSMYMA